VRLYLIRHGQAGSRDNYDMLSETGVEQARRLGEHLRAAGVTFQAAFAGAMRRQQETARVALGQIPGAPELTIDPRWNEFNLEGLWRSLAPRLLESDGDFARQYEAHAARTDLDRVMTPCDIELIRAWVRNHHACEDVEPWPDFRARVEAARASDRARRWPCLRPPRRRRSGAGRRWRWTSVASSASPECSTIPAIRRCG
jgi:broad specificity phosphatase PhoE